MFPDRFCWPGTLVAPHCVSVNVSSSEPRYMGPPWLLVQYFVEYHTLTFLGGGEKKSANYFVASGSILFQEDFKLILYYTCLKLLRKTAKNNHADSFAYHLYQALCIKDTVVSLNLMLPVTHYLP